MSPCAFLIPEAEERRKLALAEFFALRHPGGGAPTVAWCEQKAKEILEKHLIGQDALIAIGKAGAWHSEVIRQKGNEYYNWGGTVTPLR